MRVNAQSPQYIPFSGVTGGYRFSLRNRLKQNAQWPPPSVPAGPGRLSPPDRFPFDLDPEADLWSCPAPLIPALLRVNALPRLQQRLELTGSVAKSLLKALQ